MIVPGPAVPQGHGPGPPERLVVGRVVRAHGITGEVVVDVLSDDPERFAPGTRVWSGDPDGGALRPLDVAASRRHQELRLVRFVGVDDRTTAEELAGSLLSVPWELARALAPGELWPHQLEGLAVFDDAGQRRGSVEEVSAGTAHDHLVVRKPDGTTVMVPLVAALVRVELEWDRVVVTALPGLLDPEA